MAAQTKSDGQREVTTSAGAGVISEKVDDEAAPENAQEAQAAIFPVTIATLLFHFIMMLTSLYYGMLFTNWGDAVISGDNDGYYSSGIFTHWIKVGALWYTLILFAVSVTLPLCCKDRIL